jgi:ACT domain-containing protein
MKQSKSFGGTLNDPECQKLAGISRNSFYKYKRELLAIAETEQL